MHDFNHKVAAITGAGSGMGRALAELLAARGCAVAIADINKTPLEETAERIRSQDGKVSIHLLDVSERGDVDQFAADVVSQHGRVNMVFNNAGVALGANVSSSTYADMEWLMNINFWGVVYGTKAFLPYLEKVDDAHIVNTSSIFGVIAVPSQSAYNAAKFAVRGFTYALAQELHDSHINVSCVLPGGVKTNIVRSGRFVPEDNESATVDDFAAQFESMAGLTSEQAAEKILRGVQKNRLRILVGRDARFLALLERLAPVSYMRLIKRAMQS